MRQKKGNIGGNKGERKRGTNYYPNVINCKLQRFAGKGIDREGKKEGTGEGVVRQAVSTLLPVFLYASAASPQPFATNNAVTPAF